MKTFEKIPTIDLLPLIEDPGAPLLARQIREIFTHVGFAYIINHGIPQQLVDRLFYAAKQFHDLPTERKLKLKQNRFFRGYIPFESDILPPSAHIQRPHPNRMSAFIIAHEVSEDDPDFIAQQNYAGPNQWPDNLPGFQSTIEEYYAAVLILFQKLVRIFSVAFELGLTGLDAYFVKPTAYLRINHYPAQSEEPLPDQFGISPHTDNQFLTILAQDSREGLQVKNPANEWIDVPPVPGALILNTGDTMRYFTNDTLQPTPHRVISPAGSERFSVPVFVDPNMHVTIAPLPAFCSVSRPVQFPPMEYCDFSRNRRLERERRR